MKKFKKTSLISLSIKDIHDLRMFEENRDIRQSHVKRLYDSIKETGVVTGTITLAKTTAFNDPSDKAPHYYIVDGQHRSAAILLLNEVDGIDASGSAKFEVLPETMTKEEILQYVSNINSLSKKFASKEYLQLFQKSSRASSTALELQEEFKNVKMEYILIAMYPNIAKNELRSSYRKGNLSEEINPNVRDILDIASELKKRLSEKNLAEKGFSIFIKVLSDWRNENPDFALTKIFKKRIISGYIKSCKSFTTLANSQSIEDSLRGLVQRVVEQ